MTTKSDRITTIVIVVAIIAAVSILVAKVTMLWAQPTTIMTPEVQRILYFKS
jgi:hypothetical protein